ncbi:MAG: hypothetical protein K9L02_07080 [Acholeplasmataceae bacterium]|nr:hypothetical protein [Acholeplasmataceae bacterium]
MNKYIIGIDGGGTKTLGVLYNFEGVELNRVEFGFSNFSMGEEEAKQNIEKTLDELCKNLEEDRELYIQMGIAGISKLREQNLYKAKLETMFNAQVSLDSDALIALYSVKKDQNVNVILVIGGTGSVLMIGEDDHVQIVGGFGHLLGDEGSAYHLVTSALKKIIEDKESNQPDTDLSIQILKEIKAPDYQAIKDFVYNENKKTIAGLSRFIANRALNHDPDAIELFIQEGQFLAKQTLNAYHKIKNKQDVIIALRGGFLLSAPYVKETLIKELGKHIKDYQIDIHQVEPVIGAYYLGFLKLSKR